MTPRRLGPFSHKAIAISSGPTAPIKILNVAGQYLETDRRACEEKSPTIALPYPRLESQKNPGCPGHGANGRQMARINMGKDRSRKRHDKKSSQTCRPGIEATTAGPSFCPPSENHEMEQHQKIECTRQGQAEKEQVWRIEHRRFETTEEGLASVGKGIPQGEMSVAQALGQVGPRRNEFGHQVGVPGREEGTRGRTSTSRRDASAKVAATSAPIRSVRW